MITKSELAIATMTFARTADEEALLRESLEILATCDIPVYITDGGSPRGFLEFLNQFPQFIIADAPAKGLVAQVVNSLRHAAGADRRFILYTEPDKKFFFRQLDGFLAEAELENTDGIFIASRVKSGFESYAAFQQMTESCINNCCSEITGYDLDFTYGPFLLKPDLVPYLDKIDNDIGWGWRTYMFGMAARLGLTLKEFKGEYYCPPEQAEDSPDERVYRIKQCEQSLRGIVFSRSINLP